MNGILTSEELQEIKILLHRIVMPVSDIDRFVYLINRIDSNIKPNEEEWANEEVWNDE